MAYEIKDPFWQFVDHWQTLATGGLAMLAAGLTILFTNLAANREVAAAHRQIESTKRIERRRIAREAYAFYATLEAAMVIAMEGITAAREELPNIGHDSGWSIPAYRARQSIRKMAFNDIRSACLRYGGLLTLQFLRFDKATDDFANQVREFPVGTGKMGLHTGLRDQLDQIELQAASLRDEAVSGMRRCNEELAKTQDD